jgi:hypothetical protein
MSESVSGSTIKHSYTVPCASTFREAVEKMAGMRHVNVGDIARSVLLVVPSEVIAAYPDPGEPPQDDRETVILKSGPAKGRPWRRKPRLQVRMAPGFKIEVIRKALGIALSMDQGEVKVRLHGKEEARPQKPVQPEPPHPPPALGEEIERLKTIIGILSFEPLLNGVRSRDDALHVLGFPPGSRPDRRTLRAKFRMLATIHHPDSNYGSHNRMSQLNAAMEMLKDCA